MSFQRVRCFTGVASLIVMAGSIGPALALDDGDPGRVSIQGKCIETKTKSLRIKNREGMEYFIEINPKKTRVEISGEMDLSYLQRGMPVRLVVDLELQAAGRNPNSKNMYFGDLFSGYLDVISPMRGGSSMVYFGERMGGGIVRGGLSKVRSDGSLSGVFQVNGQVRAYGGGNLTVVAGSVGILIPVDRKTRVNVQGSDLRLARKGDPVEIVGKRLADGTIVAHAVRVKLSKAPEQEPKKDL